MCITAIASGLRVSEILAAQPRSIDADKETITVDCRWRRGELGPTKTKASRRTREIPGLAQELLAYAKGKSDDEYIFGSAERNGMPPNDYDLQKRVIRPAAEKAGIKAKRFGMHYFRHINITWRQQFGAHPFEAQKAAGHAQPSTTWMYTQTDPEREKEHVQKIMDYIKNRK
jgi:integrase